MFNGVEFYPGWLLNIIFINYKNLFIYLLNLGVVRVRKLGLWGGGGGGGDRKLGTRWVG